MDRVKGARIALRQNEVGTPQWVSDAIELMSVLEYDLEQAQKAAVSWKAGEPSECGWYLVTYDVSAGSLAQLKVAYLWFNSQSIDKWYEGRPDAMDPFRCPVTHWAELPPPAKTGSG